MSETTNKSDDLGLGALDATYRIIGEVSGTTGRRTFLATRRTDGAEMLVTVFSGSGTAENNALSHFASDTKILSRSRHPAVVHSIEGRWLGSRAFAVVSERPRGASVRETLATGERLANSRVAALLREINGILSWAREQGIVHRGITLDAMFIDGPTGRLQVSLLPMSISSDELPDAFADASTIGDLAWSLLAGRPLEAPDSKESLASLRPDLPRRVVNQVDRLRSAQLSEDQPDVAAVVAIIASADVLKVAEIELEKQRADYAEMARVQRERADAERTAHERLAAELLEKLHAERRDFKREVERERAALASERAQLMAEQEQLAYDIGRQQHRRMADRPDMTPPEDSDGLVWPFIDRREHHWRWVAPLVVTTAIVASALAIHSAQPHSAAPDVVAVGADTVVPTPPKVRDVRLPRGGFLTQSAGGNVSLPASAAASPKKTEAVTAVTNARDSVAPAVQHLVATADARDSVAARSRRAVRDTLLARDTTLRRDSLGFLRPDTLGKTP